MARILVALILGYLPSINAFATDLPGIFKPPQTRTARCLAAAGAAVHKWNPWTTENQLRSGYWRRLDRLAFLQWIVEGAPALEAMIWGAKEIQFRDELKAVFADLYRRFDDETAKRLLIARERWEVRNNVGSGAPGNRLIRELVWLASSDFYRMHYARNWDFGAVDAFHLYRISPSTIFFSSGEAVADVIDSILPQDYSRRTRARLGALAYRRINFQNMTNALDHSIGKNQWPVLEKFLYYSGSLDHRTDGRLLLDPSLPVSIRFAIERTARFEANRLGELGKGPNIPRAEKELATILATVMGERLLFGLENPQLGQGTGGVNLVPLVWQSLSFVTATVRYIVIHRQQLDLESIAEEILPEIRAIAKSENENRGRTGLLEYIAEGSMGLDSFFAARNEADLVEFFSTADPDSLFRP